MGTYEIHNTEIFTSPQFTYRDVGGTLQTDLNANPLLSGDVKIFTGFVNAVLDADFGAPIVPFFGGGIGFANVNLDNVTGTSLGNNFNLIDGNADGYLSLAEIRAAIGGSVFGG